MADEIHAGGHSDVVAIGDELVRAISARPLGTAVANELLQTETAVPLELAAELRHGDGKEYSPRIDLHLSQLIEVLASSKYSPDDVASLVQRNQYDDQPIQIAVARIIEDQVSHEQTTWGVV